MPLNIPVLIVACVTLLAFVAHLIGGTKETAAIVPPANDATLTANWVQAMCAFQMLGVDLLFVSGGLFAIALMDLGPVEPMLLGILSLLYLVWGIVWAIQMLWLKTSGVGLLRLPHWLVWFVCSALLYFEI